MRSVLFAVALWAAPALANISLSKTWIDFGDVTIGSWGPSDMVYVTNFGRQSVDLRVFNGCSGDFRVNNWCGLMLAPGASCTIYVQFQPIMEGFRSCQITVSTPQDFDAVNVSGRGVRP